MKTKEIIQIIGKRWFQSTCGNTYHSVTILIDNKEVAYMPFQYGYGDQYLQTARTWLEENKVIKKYDRTPFWQVKDKLKNSKMFIVNVTDVNRKKDL
jgi:hypothetical protein